MSPKQMLNIAVIAAVTTAASCCGSSTTTPTALIQVGGDYNVLKTTTSDSCATSLQAPITTPSSVTHTAGSSSFALIDHGTRSLPGQVSPDGSMTMSVYSSVVLGTIPATDTFSNGRFTTTGFTVTVTTDLSDNPNRPGTGAGACRIVATWQGSKVGAPNVIPGS